MANSSLKVVQSQPSSDDVQVYNQIRNGLMSNQITSRQVYDSLKKGDFTPGIRAKVLIRIGFINYEAAFTAFIISTNPCFFCARHAKFSKWFDDLPYRDY